MLHLIHFTFSLIGLVLYGALPFIPPNSVLLFHFSNELRADLPNNNRNMYQNVAYHHHDDRVGDVNLCFDFNKPCEAEQMIVDENHCDFIQEL